MDSMESRMDSMEAKMDKMENRMDSLESRMDRLENRMDSLETNMDERFKETNEELRKISKTVAKIEVEHGERLQILFDAFKVHDEKIDKIMKRLEMHEKILNKHSNEIYYIQERLEEIG